MLFGFPIFVMVLLGSTWATGFFANEVESDVEAQAVSEREQLLTYLESMRVKNLLAPFCNPGRMAASSHPGLGHSIEALGEEPMSLRRLGQCGALAPTRGSLLLLITVANHDNDRPGWPVGHDNWESVGDIFLDMNGSKVNPYVEAQRILREYGPLLVEVGMLTA